MIPIDLWWFNDKFGISQFNSCTKILTWNSLQMISVSDLTRNWFGCQSIIWILNDCELAIRNSYIPLWSLDVKLYFASIFFDYSFLLLFLFWPSAQRQLTISRLHGLSVFSSTWSSKPDSLITESSPGGFLITEKLANSWFSFSSVVQSAKNVEVKEKWKLWNLWRLLTINDPKKIRTIFV